LSKISQCHGDVSSDLSDEHHVITEEECRSYGANYQRGQNTVDRAAMSPQIRATISSKKTMISAYFTRQGFVSVETLPETERFNSTFFTETILPSIVRSVSGFRPKMQAQGYWMLISNAKSHNPAFSLQKLKCWDSLDWPSRLIPLT
jgi:hypothetical protein